MPALHTPYPSCPQSLPQSAWPAGAESNAMIYSIAETAKANHLKPYNYFEYLLTEIPKHLDDRDNHFCEDLLPWSDKLPAECRK